MKRGMRVVLASALLGMLAVALPASAQTAGLLPNGKQTFVDLNGQPFSSGKVYFYIPNTTTPKATWVDPGEAVPNSNPVVLDSAGRAVIYGNGQYREVLRDQFGNTIWDQLTTFTQAPCTAFGTTAGTCVQGNDSRFSPPYVSVNLAGDQSIVTDGSEQKILFDTVQFDSNSWWDNTNHRYTPQQAGKYLITLFCATTGTDITIERCSLNKDGSTVRQEPNQVPFSGANPLLVTAIVSFNGTTDYVEGTVNMTGTAGTVGGTIVSSTIQGQFIAP